MKAPVSPAVRANGFVFVSGYVPINPETGKADLGSIEVQTRRTLENVKLVLEKAGSSLEKVGQSQHLYFGGERLPRPQ